MVVLGVLGVFRERTKSLKQQSKAFDPTPPVE